MLTCDMKKRGQKTKTIFLYEQIRRDITNGNLVAGEKLPSKRELAGSLSISVITVENAYIMLEEEGYIKAIPKKGFYVRALELPIGNTVLQDTIEYLSDDIKPSSEVSPNDCFPGMAKIYRKIISETPEVLQTASPHFGCGVLRNALADYLFRYRHMRVKPSHIIIGSGAEYLYGLIVQLFGKDYIYGVEDPSYEMIKKVYTANGAKIDMLKMNENGILTSELKRTSARVLHVTPYHSFPTGITADAEKRYEYLNWAEKCNGHIIEDDFDSEFAFYKKPIDTLYSMDSGDTVVYMNTFTKSLSPAIRIAYMILPDHLFTVYSKKLGFYSCTVPVLEQYVMASFINTGAFERHLNRIRRSRNDK